MGKIEETLFPGFKPKGSGKFCRDCGYRKRLVYRSGNTFQYCGVIASNKTSTGLLKIKCKYQACGRFQKGKPETIHCA